MRDDPPTDRELITAHLYGDTRAFEALVHRHQDRLWAVALRTLGDREEAADALQDAMVSAYRHAGGYRGEAAVTTWLHRIVVNACLDRMRRSAARPTVPLPDRDLATSVDEHDRATTRITVMTALDQLPDQQRAALVLVDLQGLSVAEAAAVLEVAEGTIKSRCSRARSALAAILRTEPDDSGPPRQHDLPRAGNLTRPADVTVSEPHVHPDDATVRGPASSGSEGGQA